jgi:hypothetical protein
LKDRSANLLMLSHLRTTSISKSTLDTKCAILLESRYLTEKFMGVEIWIALHFQIKSNVQTYCTHIYVPLNEGIKRLQQQHHEKITPRDSSNDLIMECYRFAVMEVLNLAAHIQLCLKTLDGMNHAVSN